MSFTLFYGAFVDSRDTYGTCESGLNVNLNCLSSVYNCRLGERDIIYLFCRLFGRQGYAQWNLDFPKVCFHWFIAQNSRLEDHVSPRQPFFLILRSDILCSDDKLPYMGDIK